MSDLPKPIRIPRKRIQKEGIHGSGASDAIASMVSDAYRLAVVNPGWDADVVYNNDDETIEVLLGHQSSRGWSPQDMDLIYIASVDGEGIFDQDVQGTTGDGDLIFEVEGGLSESDKAKPLTAQDRKDLELDEEAAKEFYRISRGDAWDEAYSDCDFVDDEIHRAEELLEEALLPEDAEEVVA